MFNMKKMADIYKRIKNGTATDLEQIEFKMNVDRSSFKESYVISKIKEFIKHES